MREFSYNPKDELVMKLLHYFITKEGYTPIVLHGAKDEIWLENMQKEYKVVRIVSGYIRNKEQFEFDYYKTKNIVKSIKKKTFSLKLNVLSIFVDMEEDLKFPSNNKFTAINIKKEKDLAKKEVIKEFYPDMLTKLETTKKGAELFMKITTEINQNSKEATKKVDDVFTQKKPYVTYGIIAINSILMLITVMMGFNEAGQLRFLTMFGNNPYFIRQGEYYRIITSVFLHGGILHFFLNNYALYIVGSQVESFFGKTKYLLIYLYSGLIGSLLSNLFLPEFGLSIGASGAIFGLLGSILYFGYYYRVYLGNVIKSQIIPLIALNLFIGFTLAGIDNFAHIGGLIGGIVMSMAVGVMHKSDKLNEVNGKIISVILFAFLGYLLLFY